MAYIDHTLTSNEKETGTETNKRHTNQTRKQ